MSLAKLSPLMLLCVAFSASHSAEQQTPAPAPATNEQAIDVVARKLCKSEPVVGTRIPKPRKCNTPAELARYRDEARELIQNWNQRPCNAGTTTGEGVASLSC